MTLAIWKCMELNMQWRMQSSWIDHTGPRLSISITPVVLPEYFIHTASGILGQILSVKINELFLDTVPDLWHPSTAEIWPNKLSLSPLKWKTTSGLLKWSGKKISHLRQPGQSVNAKIFILIEKDEWMCAHG